MQENKQEICNKLAEAMRTTEYMDDLVSLNYEKREDKNEYVHAQFKNGRIKSVCVTADSGYAMIDDIIKHLW